MDVLTFNVHNGKGLLPVEYALGIGSLTGIHEMPHFYAMQDTPYAAS